MNIGGLVGALLPVFFVLALGYFTGERQRKCTVDGLTHILHACEGGRSSGKLCEGVARTTPVPG